MSVFFSKMPYNVSVVWHAGELIAAHLSAVKNLVKGNNNSASAKSATVG
jgi:hypothetical protein